jgi:hypothetical protein
MMAREKRQAILDYLEAGAKRKVEPLIDATFSEAFNEFSYNDDPTRVIAILVGEACALFTQNAPSRKVRRFNKICHFLADLYEAYPQRFPAPIAAEG